MSSQKDLSLFGKVSRFHRIFLSVALNHGNFLVAWKI